MTLYTEIGKSILKYIWKHKKTQIATSILSKKIQCRRRHKPDFKIYYRAITKKQHGIGTKTDRKTNGSE
jgi:hypothetical protein